MNKNNIEKQVLSAFIQATPDLFDWIKEDCKKQKGITVEVNPKPIKPFITRKMLARVACFVAIFGVVLTAVVLMLTKTPVSYVCIDVNPSFTVSLNRFDKVISIDGNNKEAQKIIEENTISKNDIIKTADEIISIVKEKEYLTEKDNSILLSVISDDREKRDTLCDKLTKSILSLADSEKYNLISQAFRMDEALNRKAKKYDTSVGKVNYVSQIASKTKYSFDNLISLKINDLANIVSENGITLSDIKANGKPSENSLIGKENAKAIVFSDLNMNESSADFISTELGANAKTLVYIITVNVDKLNSKYDIDAHSGEIVEKISFDGTVYINEKYLPKMTEDTLPKEEKNYITFTESREEQTATEGSDNIGNKTENTESGTQTPTTETEMNTTVTEPTDETPTKEDVPIPKEIPTEKNVDKSSLSEDLPDIFTSDHCIYHEVLSSNPPIPNNPYNNSVPFVTIRRYNEYSTIDNFPFTTDKRLVALICNETQFYNYFGRYDSKFNSKFFEDKALISVSFSLDAYQWDRLDFVDLYDDNNLYCCIRITEAEQMKMGSPQPYVSIWMIILNKNDIKNANDVIAYADDYYY